MTKKSEAKLEHFAREYMIDLNGTRAAIAAGYAAKSAHVTASQLLKKPKVQAEIAKFQAKISKKLDITAERVLSELEKIAFSDPRKFFNDDGTSKPITQLDDRAAACLAGIEVSEITMQDTVIGHTKKFRLWDKPGCLERLGKHLGLFADKPAIAGSITNIGIQVVNHIERPSRTAAN